jgi:hypothetical protein
LIFVFIAGVFIYIKMDSAGGSKATIAAFTEKNVYFFSRGIEGTG